MSFALWSIEDGVCRECPGRTVVEVVGSWSYGSCVRCKTAEMDQVVDVEKRGEWHSSRTKDG
jgi:hypothetical protein